jgi:hypothetical protein
MNNYTNIIEIDAIDNDYYLTDDKWILFMFPVQNIRAFYKIVENLHNKAF